MVETDVLFLTQCAFDYQFFVMETQAKPDF
jgi:hypothetical protein